MELNHRGTGGDTTVQAATKLLITGAVATVTLAGATTTAVATTVTPRVSAAVNHSIVPLGSTATISGTVTPNLRNRTIYLQTYARGAWRSLLHTRLSSTSHYSFTVRPGTVTRYAFRTYLPAAGTVRAGASRTVTLTTQPRLGCTARMSNTRPTQYSTTHVLVTTLGGASVTATAHYKTTNTTHSTTAPSTGRADIAFYTSGATRGRTVLVSITARKSPQVATCTTAFTTQ